MSENSVVEYSDVSLVDCIHRRRSMYNDTDHTVTEQECSDDIPEDLMSKLEAYVGDGQARVTVSGALSSNHRFHKAEAFVSISVSCNNNLEDVQAVHNLVRPTVQQLVHQDHEEMSLLRDTILPANEQKHHAPTGLPSAEPNIGKTVTPKPPKRTATVSVGNPEVAKPNFRR